MDQRIGDLPLAPRRPARSRAKPSTDHQLFDATPKLLDLCFAQATEGLLVVEDQLTGDALLVMAVAVELRATSRIRLRLAFLSIREYSRRIARLSGVC